jgi:hypothetical protein
MSVNVTLDRFTYLPSFHILSGIVKMTSWLTVTETFGLKTSDIVFTVGSTVHIDAPADIFFSIITDVSNYQSWDSWCPKFHFPDGEPVTVGSSGMMQVEIKAQNRTYEIPATVSHFILCLNLEI